MAAKLQCEICGGKLVGKPGGIFECENCGTEYSTEWARAKIQEITGTVKVEGTVEVTGKVQVDSTSNKETLLQRGMLALEDGKWEDAKEFFNQALNYDAQYADAYLGLAMAEEQCRDQEAFQQKYIEVDSPLRLNGNANLNRACQFSKELTDRLTQLNEDGKKADDAARLAEENVREQLSIIRKRFALPSVMISSRASHNVFLLADGTVIVRGGDNSKGERNVSVWRDIVAVSAGGSHTVGLRLDGRVVAVGNNDYGACNVAGWRNIVAIAAGTSHTIGLRADGTVVGTVCPNPKYYFGQCEVNGWKNIVAIAAGGFHSLGLCADGNVVSTNSSHSQAFRSDRLAHSDKDRIVAIAAGYTHSVGLRANGTVFATGKNDAGECNVSGWRDIVAVAAGWDNTVGLRADGTVLSTVNIKDPSSGKWKVYSWTDIVAIAAGSNHTLGLRADGTVVATEYTGDKKYYQGQCDVSGLRLFSSLETIKTERKAAMDKAEAKRKADEESAKAKRKAKIEALNAEKAQLDAELPSIKGLFAASKRAKIEGRLAEIEAVLKKLGG